MVHIKIKLDRKERESLLDQILDAIPDPVFAIDKSGKVILWNKPMERLSGISRSEILGKGNYEYSLPFYNERRPQLIDMVLKPEDEIPEMYENFKFNSDMSVEGEASVPLIDYCDWGKASPIYGTDGEIEGAVAISRSMNDIKAAQRELERSNEKFKVLFYNAPDAIAYLDREYNIVDVNPAFIEMFGYSKGECIGNQIDDLVVRGEEIQKAKMITREIFENGYASIEGIRYNKKGDPIHIAARGVFVKIVDSVVAAYAIYTDISERKKMEDRLESLSYKDQLTGIHNRRAFEKELSRLDCRGCLPLSIVFADVNGLKLINDSFGHVAGDELLEKFAKILTDSCRKGDLAARIGGDEFVLLLPNTRACEAEEIIADIKCAAGRERVCCVQISVSFGYATKDNEFEDIQTTRKKAEDNMYKQKLFEGPSMRSKTIGVVINALHEKNKREEQHSHRVSQLCEKIGAWLEMGDDDIKKLKVVGLLHDIGKIAVEEKILNKPGKLESSEWEEIKRHPEIGYRILSMVNDMSEMAEYVLSHHERWDGKGYPKGLKGQEIPLKARIIAVADAYDAMTSERAYRDALSKEEALNEIVKGAGSQFDPDIALMFVEKIIDI